MDQKKWYEDPDVRSRIIRITIINVIIFFLVFNLGGGSHKREEKQITNSIKFAPVPGIATDSREATSVASLSEIYPKNK